MLWHEQSDAEGNHEVENGSEANACKGVQNLTGVRTPPNCDLSKEKAGIITPVLLPSHRIMPIALGITKTNTNTAIVIIWCPF